MGQYVSKTPRNVNYCGISPTLGGKFTLFSETMGVHNSLRMIKKNNPGNTPCQTLAMLFPKSCLPKGWRINEILGSGSFGFVFSTIGPNNERGALKVIREDSDHSREVDIRKEVTFNKLFHSIGLSPEFRSHCKFSPKLDDVVIHTIHMGRVDTTVIEYLKEDLTTSQVHHLVRKIFELLDKMEMNYVTHGDFHPGNIGLTKTRNGVVGQMQIIDFGFSSIESFSPALDIFQLIRVNMYFGKHNSRIRREFDEEVRRMASEKYQVEDIPVGLNDLTNEWREMRRNNHI